MADAFANPRVGDPLPTNKRYWERVTENARQTPSPDHQSFDWKRWNPVTCRIRAKSGHAALQWQPCLIDATVFNGTPWPELASGRAVMDVIPATAQAASYQNYRVVVPTAPVSGSTIVDGILCGVVPAAVQLRPYVNLANPGTPLTRRVRVNPGLAGITSTWLGLDQNLNGIQEPAAGEVIWYDSANIGSNQQVQALIRIPCSPQPLWISQRQSDSVTSVTGPSWVDCGPSGSPTSGGIFVDHAVGFSIKRPGSFNFRAWGWWRVRDVATEGAAVASGSGVSSAAKIYNIAATSCELAIQVAPPSGSPSQTVLTTLGRPASSIVANSTPTYDQQIPFYVEYTGYFGMSATPVRVSLAAKVSSNVQSSSINCNAALTYFDDALHNSGGAGGGGPQPYPE